MPVFIKFLIFPWWVLRLDNNPFEQRFLLVDENAEVWCCFGERGKRLIGKTLQFIELTNSTGSLLGKTLIENNGHISHARKTHF